MPTPAPAVARVDPAPRPSIFEQRNPVTDELLFGANWLRDDADPSLLTFEMTAPTQGWLALGVRAADNDVEQAHVNTRMFVGWFDDNTGKPVLLDTFSAVEGRPIALLSARDSAIVDDSVQATQLGSGTTMRFTVRTAPFEGDADVDSLKTGALKLPSDQAVLLHW